MKFLEVRNIKKHKLIATDTTNKKTKKNKDTKGGGGNLGFGLLIVIR